MDGLKNALITKENAEGYAIYAWGNELYLEDLFDLYNITIDMDAIEDFKVKHEGLEEDFRKSIRDQIGVGDVEIYS